MNFLNAEQLQDNNIKALKKVCIDVRLLNPLKNANVELRKLGFQLYVITGYRTIEEQNKNNTNFLKTLFEKYPRLEEDVVNRTRLENLFCSKGSAQNHHCAGVGVDVVLLTVDGKRIAMGARFPQSNKEFVENSFPKKAVDLYKLLKENTDTLLVEKLRAFNKYHTRYPKIARKHILFRGVLDGAMKSADFTPWPSEYWHFNYFK